jgi:medium-chain acyl-[acyl-carrier-protein] hydrolase
MSNTIIKPELQTPPWLAFHRPNPGASLRLFCFPYAGGSAQIYRAWTGLLPTVEVCPVQLPGRGRRMKEGSFTSLVPLVENLARDLLPQLDKPFAFFGHSMGALISFELARFLRREHGLLPAQLFLSARRAPQLPNTERPLHDLPEAEFIKELRLLDGTPEEVLEHRELLSLMLPFLRADFEVCETYAYQPEPALDCPITAFGGLQDHGVSRAQLDAWREHTTGAFSLRMFPGAHFFINDGSQSSLLQVLSRELYTLAQAVA